MLNLPLFGPIHFANFYNRFQIYSANCPLHGETKRKRRSVLNPSLS